jgi:hypothetical protein
MTIPLNYVISQKILEEPVAFIFSKDAEGDCSRFPRNIKLHYVVSQKTLTELLSSRAINLSATTKMVA